jgi:hypothetical protein
MWPWLLLGTAVAIARGTRRIGASVIIDEGKLYRYVLSMQLRPWWRTVIDGAELGALMPDPYALIDVFVFDPDTLCQRWALRILNDPTGGPRDVRVWHELDAEGNRTFFATYARRADASTFAKPGQRVPSTHVLRLVSVELVPE